MATAIRAAAILGLVACGCAAPAPARAEGGATTEGLTLIDVGASAYYAPGFGDWAGVRATQARNHGLPLSEVSDADDFYCVKIGFALGNILTLRNPATGATARCVVADANAPRDNATWLSRWVVEVSNNLYQYLGLGAGNRVEVWVMEGG